jgi:menaquinone-9 beta-reductase
LGAPHTYDVIIVGGGLAGLVCAIELSRAGKSVLLIEKKEYPYHKVCGEYVSNEVLPYLRSLGFDPLMYGASSINSLRVSTPAGKSYSVPIGMGGFGISRYTMDEVLYHIAKSHGAELLTSTRVSDIHFSNEFFTVDTFDAKQFHAKLVIACHGKRDLLDKKLERNFINHHTGYLGVKYHLKTDYPGNEIGLDNFKNGYCGIVKIENDTYNLCYLYKKQKNDTFKTIQELEQQVLYKNPVLKNIFSNANFLFNKPEVINEICFDRKAPVENHILMCGDSAGLITPLCGNGMAMAITAAKNLSEIIIHSRICNNNLITPQQREKLEQAYTHRWNELFARRLFWGRAIQHCFGQPLYTGLFIRAAYYSPFKNWLIRQTHGQVLTAG